MRRKDREVTDIFQIEEIISKCRVCRIGMLDGEEVYIVPMNFGYSLIEGKLSLFFHCADEGRKIDIMKINNHVGFEMDCDHNLAEAEKACEHSFKYASIIGSGRVRFADSPEEKIKALELLMDRQTGKSFEIDEKAASTVTVFVIEAEKYTCKKNV